MTILITGASGFLGSNLAHSLSRKYSILGTYCTSRPSIPGVSLVRMELADPESVGRLVSEHRPDAVIHCAALADTGRAERRPSEAEQVNRLGTGRLVDVLPSESYLIHISTDYVYSGQKSWFLETDEPDPITAYGRSKLQAEREVERFRGGWSVLRLALLYGGRPEYRRCFSDGVYDRLKIGERVRLFSDEYRTPLYLADVISAIETLLEQRPSGEVFNVGGPDRVSRAEFGEILARETGLDSNLIDRVQASACPTPVPRPKDLSLCSDKIRSALRICTTPLREGIARAYRAHLKGDSN